MRNSATAGLKKPAIMQKFPDAVLTNTTTKNLVNGSQSIEVFPPAVFFKGKHPQLSSLNLFQISSPTRTTKLRLPYVTSPKTSVALPSSSHRRQTSAASTKTLAPWLPVSPSK